MANEENTIANNAFYSLIRGGVIISRRPIRGGARRIIDIKRVRGTKRARGAERGYILAEAYIYSDKGLFILF